MFPYAERAGIGYRIGRTFYFTRQFESELSERRRILRPMAEEERIMDKVKVAFWPVTMPCVSRCERVIPEDRRHFDLLTLCLYKAYESMMMTNLLEQFGPHCPGFCFSRFVFEFLLNALHLFVHRLGTVDSCTES